MYLRVAFPRLLLKRIAARVRQGGHAVPKADVLRRYKRSRQNFEAVHWRIGGRCTRIPGRSRSSLHRDPDTMAKTKTTRSSRESDFAKGVGKALVRAAAAARVTARRYGTPIYVWENGKVVAKRP